MATKSRTKLGLLTSHLNFGVLKTPQKKKVGTKAFGLLKHSFGVKSSGKYVKSLRKAWR